MSLGNFRRTFVQITLFYEKTSTHRIQKSHLALVMPLPRLLLTENRKTLLLRGTAFSSSLGTKETTLDLDVRRESEEHGHLKTLPKSMEFLSLIARVQKGMPRMTTIVVIVMIITVITKTTVT